MSTILLFSLIFVASTAIAEDTTYFISNDAMLEIERISSRESSEHEYVLRKYAPKEDVQRSVLYRNGEVYRVLRETFDDKGNIFSYVVDDKDGQQIELREYSYNIEGSPRSIRRTLSDGTVEVVLFTLSPAIGRTNITLGSLGSLYEREYYNKDGNKLFMERWKGTTLIYKEDYQYDNSVLKRIISEDLVSGEYIENEYVANLVAVRKRYQDLRKISEIRFTYDEEERVSSETQTTESGEQQIRYSYGEEGEIVQEIETLDGIPVSIVEYLSEDKKVELRYRKGRLIFRREYEGERPVLEYQYSENGGVKIERVLRIPE